MDDTLTLKQELTRFDTVFGPAKVASADLLKGNRKIVIDHDGVEYTLHLTRQNKLLLTK